MGEARRASLGGFLCACLIIVPVFTAQNTVAVSYNNDALIELTRQQYTRVWGAAVGDTDRDGKKELVTNYDWYFGSGNPRLVFFEWIVGTGYVEDGALDGVSLAKSNPLQPTPQITVSDADRDGDLDVIFAGSVAGVGGLYVYSWDGTAYSQIGFIAGSFVDATAGDADGDGRPEVLAVTDSQVSVYTWSGTAFALTTSWSVPEAVTFVRVGNVDSDPEPEVVLATGDLNVRSYRWDGSAYVPEGAGAVGFGFIAMAMGIGDVDNDGLSEVVRMDYHRNIVVYGWTGSGTFSVEWNGISTPDTSDTIGHGDVGDSDNDGVPEIVVGHQNHVGANSLYVYKFVGGTYVEDWNSGWLDSYVHTVAIGDADNDGLNEIIAGSGAWGRVWVFSAASNADLPPRAVASVTPGVTYMGVPVTFDARGSQDDHGITRYLWDFGDGNTDMNAVVIHAYAARGVFAVSLTVWDTLDQNDTDGLSVIVENRPPIANAGPDRSSFKRQSVTVDGGASSDLDGDTLSFSWTQLGGEPVALAGDRTATAVFTPVSSGLYVFRLVVNDGWGGSSSDTVNASVENQAPLAGAGLDRTVRKKMVVVLDGTSSLDPDGDPLTYSWTQTAGPPVALTGSGTAAPSFVPPVGGSYAFQLAVDDGDGGTAMDNVEITAVNAVPIADAGLDRAVPKRTLVVLSATASSDPDADPLTFSWVQIAGPPVSLVGPGTASPAFLPVATGVYEFRVTVNDDDIGTDEDFVVVAVVNAPPTITWTSPASGSLGLVVGDNRTLAAVAVDADGDALTYRWTVNGVSVDGTGPLYEFRADRAGTYRINVSVTDGEGWASHEWTLTVSEVPAPAVDLLSWWPLAVGVIIAVVGVLIGWRRGRKRTQPD